MNAVDVPERWTPRVAASFDAPEGQITPMGWNEAQGWCNFVLLRPEVLPDRAVVEQPTLRPEAPPGRSHADNEAGRSPWTATNRAAHRCTIVTPQGRVRLKQFLYDWAPPAFDHPALWKSEVRPFAAGPRLGWLGIDYLRRTAAALHAHRTMVELSVETGDVSDEDLVSICRGLRPVSDDARKRIDATPLGALAYAHRHPDPIIPVPIGYFRHHRAAGSLRLQTYVPPDVPADLPGAATAAQLARRFPIDSVFVVGPPGEPLEADWVLRRTSDAGTTLRLLATRGDGDHAIDDPPDVDAQPCKLGTCTVGATRVHCAWSDARYGPYEAVWTQGDTTYMLLARPRWHTNWKWFVAVLAEAIG